jgi:hypothetical protein
MTIIRGHHPRLNIHVVFDLLDGSIRIVEGLVTVRLQT